MTHRWTEAELDQIAILRVQGVQWKKIGLILGADWHNLKSTYAYRRGKAPPAPSREHWTRNSGKNFVLTPELKAKFEAEAHRLGISQQQLFRNILTSYFGE